MCVKHNLFLRWPTIFSGACTLLLVTWRLLRELSTMTKNKLTAIACHNATSFWLSDQFFECTIYESEAQFYRYLWRWATHQFPHWETNNHIRWNFRLKEKQGSQDQLLHSKGKTILWQYAMFWYKQEKGDLRYGWPGIVPDQQMCANIMIVRGMWNTNRF